MPYFFRLMLVGLLSLPSLCLAQNITLTLKSTQVGNTVGIAPYELSFEPVKIKPAKSDTLHLRVQPIPVDLDDDTPYEVAERMLSAMRRAARINNGTRKAIRKSPTWGPLLLPYRNLLRRKFTGGRRRISRMFLSNAQAEIERQFDSENLARAKQKEQKEEADRTNHFLAGKKVPVAVPGAKPPPASGAGPSVLYRREMVFTTFNKSGQRADHRILGVTLTDAGANAADGEHYRVCVRYSTESGTFVSGTAVTTETNSCPPQANTVTAYLKFSNLDRVLFVEKIMQEFKPLRLTRIDSATADYSQVVIAGAELIQKTQAAADSLASQQARPARLRDLLDTLQSTADLARLRRTSTLDSLRVDTTGTQDSKAKFREKITQAQAQADSKYKTRKVQLEGLLLNAKKASGKADGIYKDTLKAALKALTAAIIKTRPPVEKAVAKEVLLDLEPASANTATLREALENIYLDYLREQTLLLAAPVAGTLDLLPVGNVYYPRITQEHGQFLLDSLELEVEDGAVMGLKMMGRMNGAAEAAEDGQKVSFESRAPIGISSDRDLNREWSRQRLWLQYPLLNHGPPHDAYVRLTDLLRYYPRLNAQGGDRSPADGVYRVRVDDALPRRTFTKIATAKLLQARLYTDLNGIRADNPNGLVQVDIDKKFIFGAPWSKASPNFQVQTFGYFTPYLSLNKIEQKSRYLPLRPTATAGEYGVNTIDLLRYTYLRVGGDYNLVGMRLPRFKSDFAFDFGFGLQRVDIHDDKLTRLNRSGTVLVDSALNVGSYGFALKARIRPDSRFGLLVRVGYYRYTLFNDRDGGNNLRITQLPNSDKEGHYTLLGGLLYRYWYQGVIQYEMTGRVKVSENAEYFARAQLSHLFYESNRTFVQLQTGFQFDIFGPRREAPPGPSSVWMTSVSK